MRDACCRSITVVECGQGRGPYDDGKCVAVEGAVNDKDAAAKVASCGPRRPRKRRGFRARRRLETERSENAFRLDQVVEQRVGIARPEITAWDQTGISTVVDRGGEGFRSARASQSIQMRILCGIEEIAAGVAVK